MRDRGPQREAVLHHPVGEAQELDGVDTDDAGGLDLLGLADRPALLGSEPVDPGLAAGDHDVDDPLALPGPARDGGRGSELHVVGVGDDRHGRGPVLRQRAEGRGSVGHRASTGFGDFRPDWSTGRLGSCRGLGGPRPARAPRCPVGTAHGSTWEKPWSPADYSARHGAFASPLDVPSLSRPPSGWSPRSPHLRGSRARAPLRRPPSPRCLSWRAPTATWRAASASGSPRRWPRTSDAPAADAPGSWVSSRPSSVPDPAGAEVDTWFPSLQRTPAQIFQRQVDEVQGVWEVMWDLSRWTVLAPRQVPPPGPRGDGRLLVEPAARADR